MVGEDWTNTDWTLTSEEVERVARSQGGLERKIMSGLGDVMMRIFTCSKNILSFLSLSHCLPEEAVTVRLVLTALLQDSILLSSPAFYTGGAAI